LRIRQNSRFNGCFVFAKETGVFTDLEMAKSMDPRLREDDRRK
jgi:hypothetical protein